MPDAEVSLIVKFKPTKKHQKPLAAQLLKLVENIRCQPACLHFDVFRSVDDRNWFIYQVWESREALERYQHSFEATQLRLLLHESTASPSEEWRLDALSA
jgi:quinol monooxygenase YgiN